MLDTHIHFLNTHKQSFRSTTVTYIGVFAIPPQTFYIYAKYNFQHKKGNVFPFFFPLNTYSVAEAKIYNRYNTNTGKLTGLCTWIEKRTCSFDCHRSDGAICYLCTRISASSVSGQYWQKRTGNNIFTIHQNDRKRLYISLWSGKSLPACVVALRALSSKIAASYHLFGCALSTETAWYENFFRCRLPTNCRTWRTLWRWLRRPCTRTRVPEIGKRRKRTCAEIRNTAYIKGCAIFFSIFKRTRGYLLYIAAWTAGKHIIYTYYEYYDVIYTHI